MTSQENSPVIGTIYSNSFYSIFSVRGHSPDPCASTSWSRPRLLRSHRRHSRHIPDIAFPLRRADTRQHGTLFSFSSQTPSHLIIRLWPSRITFTRGLATPNLLDDCLCIRMTIFAMAGVLLRVRPYKRTVGGAPGILRVLALLCRC